MSLFRFTSNEVKLEVDCLQELIGMRVGNIHQTGKDTILIKFWKLGVSRNLLIVNAIRFHCTDFPREKPKTPPEFCCRLRKFLRFRKLDDIIQPGNDRAVYFCFGDLRLCLELFQAGNIILFQESDQKILALLRYHVIQGTTIIGVNQNYIPEQFRSYTPPTDEEYYRFLSEGLEKTNQKMKSYLTKIFPFHRTEFVCHALHCAGYPIDLTVENFQYDKEKADIMLVELRKFDEILLSKPEPRPPRPPFVEGQEPPPPPPEPKLPPKPVGYIYSPTKQIKDQILAGMPLSHWDSKFVTKYDTFDQACDHFWSTSELQTANKVKANAEAAPVKKVQGVKRNFDKKKNQLQSELDFLNKTGRIIQDNATEIEQCRMIINSLIGNHVRWDEIRESIRAYQECGNELASMIDKVEFEKGSFWCLVPDEEGNINRVLIDLRKTAYANASAYYDKRGSISDKLQRTIAVENDVIKKVDKEAKSKKISTGLLIQERRKTWWFERFHWFITTENYLVLAGRDKIQNDVLVRHYLKKGDLYLHAEIVGAASVVIKNPSGKPVSPISIQQAAEFAVSRSVAWKTNEPCECFWVHYNQVTKTLPGQPPCPAGSFYITGEKNKMTMTMPQMGIGILFHVTEQHVNAHLEERRIRVESDEEQGSPEEHVDVHIPNPTSEEAMQQLPFPVKEEVEATPETTEEQNQSDDEYDEEEEEEDIELTDEELARIALEQPERADVAERRMARKAKRNRPKPKKAPVDKEVAQVMESEGIPVDIDVTGINALTGMPKNDDEFYASYIMVAPLDALISFKYRIKFTPGETKKGKAWPIMQNYFTSIKGSPPEQVALIKLIPEGDVINQLPFNLHIQLGAGGTAAMKKRQQSKKNKKKNKKKGKDDE